MPRNPSIYIPLWERALESEIGIAVVCNKPQLLKVELYRARELAQRPEFDDIIMFLPASGEEVFLCRKTVEID